MNGCFTSLIILKLHYSKRNAYNSDTIIVIFRRPPGVFTPALCAGAVVRPRELCTLNSRPIPVAPGIPAWPSPTRQAGFCQQSTINGQLSTYPRLIPELYWSYTGLILELYWIYSIDTPTKRHVNARDTPPARLWVCASYALPT